MTCEQESNPHPIESENSKKPLTSEYAAKLLTFSFKFSQGNRALQRSIYYYLHKLNPKWRVVDGEFKEKMSAVASSTINKLMFEKEEDTGKSEKPKGLHKEIGGKNDIDGNLGIEIDIMSRILGDIPPSEDASSEQVEWDLRFRDKSKDFFALRIAIDTVQQDFLYLVERKGRERRQPNSTNQPHDPWSSFFIEYIMNGRRTGMDEYDHMFKDCKDETKKFKQSTGFDGDMGPRLKEIISVYNQKHPHAHFEINTI